jgi:hypothetical protein
MNNMTARAVSTVGIWLGVAISLAAGAFRQNWTGDSALFTLLLIVVALCVAATLATAAVWHGSAKPAEIPFPDRARTTAEPDGVTGRGSSTAFRQL